LRAGILALHPGRKREAQFECIEFTFSIVNVSGIAGVIAGITAHTVVADWISAAMLGLGILSIVVMLVLARLLFPLLSLENRARALITATFGGGNRGYVLLLLLLGILSLEAERRANIVAIYFLIDLGNFIVFLAFFSSCFPLKYFSTTSPDDDIGGSNNAIRRGSVLVIASTASFFGGLSIQLIPALESAQPLIRDLLSAVLLLLATFNMFVALFSTHTYEMRRLFTVLAIFLFMRFLGVLVLIGLVYLSFFGRDVGIASVGAVLIAIVVLFVSPPSSLVGDMFAANGVDHAITKQAKSDAAVLNLIFISVLSTATFLIIVIQFAASTLP
jgi:hypothetical protein